MVDITVTGEVERCIETSRSFAVTLKVDDGGKFPKRLTIWTNQKLEQGATVTFTSHELPYLPLDNGQVRTYTTRDGTEKVDTKLTYPGAHIVGDAAPQQTDDEEVPF